MPDTIIEIEGGTLLAAEGDTLELPGVLVPFGEVGSTNLGRFTVDENSFSIPADLTGCSVNVEHVREDVVGTLVAAEKDDTRISTRIRFADTPAGRTALQDAKSGKRSKLSVEIKNVVVRAGKAIAGEVFGAAIVSRPAFPSATLLASAPDTLEDVVPEIVQEPAPAPADAEPAAPAVIKPKEETVTAATIPATLQAGAPVEQSKDISRHQAFAIMTRAVNGQANEEELELLTRGAARSAGDLSGATLFAALNSVKYDGTGGMYTGVGQPAWVGQVYQAIAYRQKYAPLLSQGDLTGLHLAGWKWGTKPAGGTWAGNKAAVNTNTPTTVAVTTDALRYSGGHDLARELQDFRTFGGSGDFIEAYWTAMGEDYSKWEDVTVALTDIVAAATSLEADNPAGLDIGPGFSALIDGAVAVIDAGGLPSFGIVDSTYYKGMLKAARNDVLGYLTAALNLQEGTLESFHLVSAPTASLDSNIAIVGAREAATFKNLPGVPIRVNAPDLVNGGTDTGVYGYAGVQVNAANQIIGVTAYSA